MTLTERRIASYLLQHAAGEYARHICNDFYLRELVADVEERRALMKAYHEYNGDPESFDPAGTYEIVSDFALMSYLADRLDEEKP